MKDAGVCVTSVETALFELLGAAEDDRFKQILKIVKWTTPLQAAEYPNVIPGLPRNLLVLMQI